VSRPKEYTYRMPVWKNTVRHVDEKEEVMTQGCGKHSALEHHD
jgi:hypothetical protein